MFRGEFIILVFTVQTIYHKYLASFNISYLSLFLSFKTEMICVSTSIYPSIYLSIYISPTCLLQFLDLWFEHLSLILKLLLLFRIFFLFSSFLSFWYFHLLFFYNCRFYGVTLLPLFFFLFEVFISTDCAAYSFSLGLSWQLLSIKTFFIWCFLISRIISLWIS